jgi:WD40 repeat protein
VAFSPDGRYILTTGVGGISSSDGQSFLWDVRSGKKIQTFEDGPGGFSQGHGSVIAFSPGGKTVLIRGFNASETLYDIASGNKIREFANHNDSVNSVAFSPDGKYVLSGSDDKTARLWDTSTGEQIRVFNEQNHAVLSVAFSPDGDYILTGLDDGTARLWNRASGQPLRTLKGHSGPINSVAFSPDGKYVLTGSADGTARLWNTDYHDTIRFVCSLLWRDFTNQERTQYSISDNTPTCPKP